MLGPNYLAISIPKSKAGQFKQGSQIVIARSGAETCPVAMLEQYLARINTNLSSQLFLFRPIAGSRLCKLGHLTYTRLRELLKNNLEELGFSSTEFGVYSLRAGGATAARRGMPDRLFKKHGRWRSETAKDGYIEDSLEQRLAVTEKLGL